MNFEGFFFSLVLFATYFLFSKLLINDVQVCFVVHGQGKIKNFLIYANEAKVIALKIITSNWIQLKLINRKIDFMQVSLFLGLFFPINAFSASFSFLHFIHTDCEKDSQSIYVFYRR